MNLDELNNLDLKQITSASFVVQGVVLGVLFILIVGAGYYMDWSSGFDELEAARREEKTLRETYTIKKRQAINYQAYKQRLADTEKALAAMLRQLPNKAEMDALLSDINQTGVSRGLEFDLFRPGSESTQDFYAVMPVSIRVTGGYHDLGYFASDVARLPRIVTIHDVVLTPLKGDRLVMDATLRTYRYLDEGGKK